MSTQVTFVKRTLEDIDNTREGVRGRVSYPIIKGFMENGDQVSEVMLEGTGRKPETLQMLLRSYVETHRLPVKVLCRKKRLFLIRLDIDDKGKAIPDWKEKLAAEKMQTVGT